MLNLHVTHRADSTALYRFAFDRHGHEDACIACTRLDGPEHPEAWLTDGEIEIRTDQDAVIHAGQHLTMVSIAVDETTIGLEAATALAYRRLLSLVRGARHGCILRIWNYFAAINAGAGDNERYRRFCVGRAAAVDAAFNRPPPAATAIGSDGPPDLLRVIALCTERPGIALENPRQTPAWRYPREYGPVPPGFSRGALTGTGPDARLLASGTASIVGHRSLYPDDCADQLRESLANLESLLAEGSRHGPRFSLSGCTALRVYLRRPDDLTTARQVIAASTIPAEPVVYLRGDICRRELLVELEGVFAPEHA